MINLKKMLFFVVVVLAFPVAVAMAGGKGHSEDHHHKGDDHSHKDENKCPWESFGDFTSVFELTSTCEAAPDCYDGTGTPYTYSGVTFTKKNLKFQDISKLSTDYNVTDTNCGGGSPRFSIIIQNTGGAICADAAAASCQIWVYIGPGPSWNTCNLFPGWQSTGNLIDSISTDNRWDSSQLALGGYGKTYAETLAFAGPLKVLYIDLVVDGGWTDPEPGQGQDILVRNVMVNNYTLNANGEFCSVDKSH